MCLISSVLKVNSCASIANVLQLRVISLRLLDLRVQKSINIALPLVIDSILFDCFSSTTSSSAQSSLAPSLRQQHQCPGSSAVKRTIRLKEQQVTTLVRVVSLCSLLSSQIGKLSSLLNLLNQDLFLLTVPTELLAWVEDPHASLRLHK